VRHAIKKLDGVEKVAVDLDRGLVDVWFARGSRVGERELRDAIRRCGFDARSLDWLARAPAGRCPRRLVS
jgi:copper chaperone CopZ